MEEDMGRTSWMVVLLWKLLYIVASSIGIVIFSRWMKGRTYRSAVTMQGKTVIITGANQGIGLATATEMAKRDARVILACRDVNKAKTAEIMIRKQTSSGTIIIHRLDLASFASIREFADTINSTEDNVNVLINNAGVWAIPFTHTEDGLEMTIGIHHFGHFLLTELLLDKLKKSTPSRIVVVSSVTHHWGTKMDFENLHGEKSYSTLNAYSTSKLANCLHARQLARRLVGSGVDVYCVRPGFVDTSFSNHEPIMYWLKMWMKPLMWIIFKTPLQGCQTILYCAIEPTLEGVSGRFYNDCREESCKAICSDEAVAKRLWDISVITTRLA